jgi:hypothetical protein
VAFLVLDCERMRDGYADIIPCVPLLSPEMGAGSDAYEVEEASVDEAQDTETATGQRPVADRDAEQQLLGVHTFLSAQLHLLHSNVLRKSTWKLAILIVSVLLNLTALISVSHVSIGLDQQVALPQDSYLQQYYRCAAIPSCCTVGFMTGLQCCTA